MHVTEVGKPWTYVADFTPPGHGAKPDDITQVHMIIGNDADAEREVERVRSFLRRGELPLAETQRLTRVPELPSGSVDPAWTGPR